MAATSAAIAAIVRMLRHRPKVEDDEFVAVEGALLPPPYLRHAASTGRVRSFHN